jgi:DNA-binding HxlR family transcriptional regulator
MAKRYGQACPVARTLELVGERWTLLIARDLLQGPRRFQDLQASLPGIAPNILSERLKLMEEHGLICRRFYSDHPPRAEYLLTQKGQGLGHVVGALAVWGSRHLYPRAALVHDGCGEPVHSAYYCPKCGERVRGSAVKLAKQAVNPRAAPDQRPTGEPRGLVRREARPRRARTRRNPPSALALS